MSLSKAQKNRLTRLIEIAKNNKAEWQCRRQFHLAAIFDGKQMLSMACNTSKTHPSCQLWYPSLIQSQHAEFAAITAAKRANFKGCSIYVIRIDNNGEPALSAPCPYCAKLITSKRFSLVIHT